MPQSAISPLTRGRARRLRRDPTDAERRLWPILQGLNRPGFHWRRQTPVGPYIADFACLAAKLIVEVDGGQHAENARDEARDDWMRGQGFTVIRLWNVDVLGNPEGCWAVVEAAIDSLIGRDVDPRKTPTPTRPHKGGGSATSPALNQARQASPYHPTGPGQAPNQSER